MRLRDLADYAATFDKISEGATYPATEFVTWMQREAKARPFVASLKPPVGVHHGG